MKQRIELSFTEEELDFFLKENYGYGIWHFKHSLFEIFIPYYPKKAKHVYQLIKKRVKQLENMKMKILELLDDFLTDINFYIINNELCLIKNTKWTLQKRKNFVLQYYKLNDFFLIIDRQINSYKEAEVFKSYEKFISRGGSLPLHLKPLNLVALTWSYVMKTGKKVDWINMENLINWFSKNIGQTKVLDYYGIRKCDSPPSEILRFTRNKYKNTLNDSWAKNIFISSFEAPFEPSLDEWIGKFPNPLEEMELFINSMLMSVNKLVIFEDVSMFKKWIKGFNR